MWLRWPTLSMALDISALMQHQPRSQAVQSEDLGSIIPPGEVEGGTCGGQRHIKAGKELTFDYGSREIPWIRARTDRGADSEELLAEERGEDTVEPLA